METIKYKYYKTGGQKPNTGLKNKRKAYFSKLRMQDMKKKANRDKKNKHKEYNDYNDRDMY